MVKPRGSNCRKLADEERDKLLNGWALGVSEYTDDELRALWEEHGAELLRGWIAEKPGSRCWAWWQFDSREPRRMIRGKARGDWDHPDKPAWTRRLTFGVPACWIGSDPMDPPIFEGEGVYLQRLDLLTADERKALKGRDLQALGHHFRVPGARYDEE